jgi:hypothetical protein
MRNIRDFERIFNMIGVSPREIAQRVINSARRLTRKYIAGPSKDHVNKPLPAEFLKHTSTRQTRREALRREEYLALGVGTHTRPKIDASRKVLRSIARSIAQRRYREATALSNSNALLTK